MHLKRTLLDKILKALCGLFTKKKILTTPDDNVIKIELLDTSIFF